MAAVAVLLDHQDLMALRWALAMLEEDEDRMPQTVSTIARLKAIIERRQDVGGF